MKRAISKPRLQGLIKAREAEKKAVAAWEAVQRDNDAEAVAAARRAEQAVLQDEENLRKLRNRELYRVGGIAAKVGLTGVEEYILESLFTDARKRLDCGEQPWLAAAALVEQAGLGKESLEVILGILMRGREVLDDVGVREKLAAKGREKLRETEERRNRQTRQTPIPANRIDRPPMMVKFTEPPSTELRAELKRLSMKFFREEGAWRGPNGLATAVRTAIKASRESSLVAYPADWRDD